MNKVVRPTRREILRYAGGAAAVALGGTSSAASECLESTTRGQFIGGTFDRQSNCIVNFYFDAAAANTKHGMLLIGDHAAISAFPQSSIGIRFGTPYLECINGTAMYQHSEELRYEHGKTYRIRVQADLTRRLYDVWATAPDRRTYRIADSFAFRPGNDSSALQSYAVVNDDVTGSVRLCNFYVNRDKWGFLKLYRTSAGSRQYFAPWDEGPERTLYSRSLDPYDPAMEVRGDKGQVTIKGENGGYAVLSGEEPRLYFYRNGMVWGRAVEITGYMMRVGETGSASTQGFVIGARTEHQSVVEADPSTWCRGAGYYSRLLYSPARKLFQKELRHHESYTINQVSEGDRVQWGTDNGQFPRDWFIGVKFCVRNVGASAVRLSLFYDPVSGGVPGKDTWTKILEYTDEGQWGQLAAGSTDNVQAACGYATNRVLTEPATSIFIRNTKIKEARYAFVSIREVNPLAS